MVSNPPGKCCYEGVKHEGEASGKFSQLGDFEIYTVGEKGDYGILILTDAIGHRFINAQLIADQCAANGYFVMMPDLFYGDPVEVNRTGGFDLMKWLDGEYNEAKKAHQPPHVDPIVDACIIEMKTKYGVKKLGGIGYCFGGRYVVRHLRPDLGKLDAGYTAHQSLVTEEELKDIKGPLSLAAAEIDTIFTAEQRHKSEEILQELGHPYQLTLYGGVEHGFACRVDLADKKKKYAKEAAFFQAMQWFDEHLKQ